jgi:hypothetical protein
MDKAVAAKCERRQEGAQGIGGRATVYGIAARGGRCPRRILASLHRVRRKELAPWSSHGPRHYQQQKHQGRQASGTTGAQGAAVKITTQRACVSVRDARRAASWTGLMQFQCGAGNAPLQSRKLPISAPRAASARICRGLDMASFYLWFRADEHRRRRPARRCHSKSNGVRRWCPGGHALLSPDRPLSPQSMPGVTGQRVRGKPSGTDHWQRG